MDKREAQLNNKKGFTLAELLTVLLISMILMTIGMVAVVNYAKNLKLTEMDNGAKQIFIAAQNHLTEAKASGKADNYFKEHPDASLTDASSNMGLHISTYTPNDYNQELNGNIPLDFKNEYYYLIYTPKHTNYSDSFLQYLLPLGAVDEELRTEGSYIIEYNPTSGDVYGVFYTNDFKEGQSLDVADIETITINNGRTDKTIRKNYVKGVVGYYGGASGDALEKDELKAPTIEVENEDILKIKVRDSNYFAKQDGVMLETSLLFNVHGVSSNKDKELVLPLNRSDGNNPKADNNSSQSTIKYWTVNKVKDERTGKYVLEYTINLDDITTLGGHFADLFTAFTPGENITITAKSVCDVNGTGSSEESSATTNSLFAAVSTKVNDNNEPLDVTQVDKVSTAYISCGRHLENLDGTISNIPTPTDKSVRYVSIIKDIDWNDFFNNDKSQKTITAVKSKNNSTFTQMIGGTGATEGNFYPIQRGDLISINGHGCTISNIKVNNTFVDTSTAGKGDGGLFRTITCNNTSFACSNLILKDFQISADKNAGALFGETISFGSKTMILNNIVVDNGNITANGSNGSAAGLMGYVEGSNNRFTNCSASAVVKNTGKTNAKAGGFAGKINGSNFIIENCYVGGHTSEGKYLCQSDKASYNVDSSISYAGGFIGIAGASNGEFINCFTTASVSGDYAGGFIGYREENKKIKYTNCYTLGPVKANDGDENHQGAFLGSLGTSTVANNVFKNCEYLDNVVDDHVYWKVDAVGDATISSGLTGQSYTHFKSLGTIPGPVTFNYDETYGNAENIKAGTNEKYPFKAVGKQISKDKQTIRDTDSLKDADTRPNEPVPSDAKSVYYGDWLKEPKIIEGKTLIAYAEKMNNESKYRYSTLGAAVKDGKIVATDSYSDLIDNTDSKNYVEEYEYVLLSPRNDITNEFGDNDVLQSLKSEELIYLGEEKPENRYFVYHFKSTFATKNSTDISTKKIDGWKISSDKTVTMSFVPGFGNAMTISTSEGTPAIEPEVRNEKQLNNIDTDEKTLKASYKQTCNIVMSNSYSNENVIKGKFAGTYTGEATGAKDENGLPLKYSISGFKQEITGSKESTGLFEEITGTVKSLIITGNVTVKSSSVSNVGILSGKTKGTIDRVNVLNGVINANGYKSGASIGLLTGLCEKDSTVDLCSASGDTSKIVYGVKTASNVGGLIGKINNSNIDRSWSNIAIDFNDAAINAGGLIGAVESKDANCYIGNSYAITYYPHTKGKLLLGTTQAAVINRIHCALKTSGGKIDSTANVKMFDVDSDTQYLTYCFALTSEKDPVEAEGVIKYFANETQYKTFNNFKDINQTGKTPSWKAGTNYPILIDNLEK